MNSEIIEDLKQFVANTVSQAEQRITDDVQKMIGDLRQEVGGLRQEMRDGFAGVGEAIDELSHVHEARLEDHEQRITKLEPAA